MLGAIIGDIAGSRFEFNNIKTKEFDLLSRSCWFTDDSVMTIAVAHAILQCNGDWTNLSQQTVKSMQLIGRHYPHCGYGGRFKTWMFSDNPQPYNSLGNGAAMRVSAAGWAASSLEECKTLARKVTEVTHNHPKGLKAAEAVAVAIYMARTGADKQTIIDCINRDYYRLDFTIDQIRPTYTFDVTCQGSVPQALEVFAEGNDYEDVIRTAVSLGGDCDTIAAIAGSVAEAYYGVPQTLREKALDYFLDPGPARIVREFEQKYGMKLAK
ncbi:MAG: ADP-ribosylglycohydrolase family protein [Clostridia bacterium]|nr:ADP-ribosylglycohydrolase family protein [Clostridia bacterium]